MENDNRMPPEDRTILIEDERQELPLLADRYRLLERIGAGGVAEVWRAIDERLDRDVAVKILRDGTDEAFRRRFTEEARRAASISHPNVVMVFDAQADGEAFIVMELVRGRTLDELVRERGPLPIATVTTIVGQIAAGLDAAHARGIVHCDVKPANVVVDEGGVAKLADFGIARAAESAPEHELVGTPRYVAPELVDSGVPTPRSDVYGLGLVAWELLAGTSPFRARDTQELLRERLEAGPPPLRSVRLGIPQRVDAAVAKALARDPERRYASAGAFARALSDATAAAGLTAPAGAATVGMITAPRRARPLIDRRALLSLIAALLIGAGVIAFLREFGGTLAPARVPDASPAAPRTPNVVGMRLTDAANALIRAGFKSPVNWVVDPSASGPAQTVVRQEPPADGGFSAGQEATLYIVGPAPGGGGKGKGEKEKDD